jgi:hypothetical protein
MFGELGKALVEYIPLAVILLLVVVEQRTPFRRVPTKVLAPAIGLIAPALLLVDLKTLDSRMNWLLCRYFRSVPVVGFPSTEQVARAAGIRTAWSNRASKPRIPAGATPVRAPRVIPRPTTPFRQLTT